MTVCDVIHFLRLPCDVIYFKPFIQSTKGHFQKKDPKLINLIIELLIILIYFKYLYFTVNNMLKTALFVFFYSID